MQQEFFERKASRGNNPLPDEGGHGGGQEEGEQGQEQGGGIFTFLVLIANSAQTEYCSTFLCVLVRHRRDISSFLDNLTV